MIITKLKGGLGNQMFQYACGKAISKVCNTKLYLDITGFAKNETFNTTPRSFELDVFNLKVDLAPRKLLDNFFSKKTLLSKVKKKLFNLNFVNFVERDLLYTHEVFKQGRNLYLDGYWQSEKYFKSIENELRNDFSIKPSLSDENMLILEQIKNCNSVSVHIRRGDYVTLKVANEYHGVCSTEYYQKAVNYISKKIFNPVFYIFSDEPKWVEENFKIDFPYKIIAHNQGRDSYVDLKLMSSCKHQIIANSSFSWWGAWLNENSEKIVITPKNWFIAKNINTKDLIPENWLII